jgi:hypothetical protein
MNSPEKIRQTLDTILVPGVKRSLVMMNLVKDVSVTEGKAYIILNNAALMKGTREWLTDVIKAEVGKLDSVKGVDVSYAEPNRRN